MYIVNSTCENVADEIDIAGKSISSRLHVEFKPIFKTLINRYVRNRKRLKYIGFQSL